MKEIIKYNSWEDKVPFGALLVNQGFRISVEIDETYNINDISWVILKEDVEISRISLIQESDKYYRAEFNGFNEDGIYFYHFEVELESNGEKYKRYYGRSLESSKSCEYLYENLNKYQITVHKPCKAPNWYKEGILYHIFVDRFNNGNRNNKPNEPKKNSFIYGNWDDTPMYIKDEKGDISRWDFHGGNLKGIIDKLGYLKKLGVSIIYLSPIFEASSNHKYDTGDYEKIDPMFGDEDIFKELIDKADKKGISIILDGVFSHTGADSKYFNKYGTYDAIGAYQSENSKYRTWYDFKENSNEYESWWGIKALPNVNELEPSYVDYIIKNKDSIIRKWTSMGVKGWRLDVCDELPTEFIKMLRQEMKDVDKESVLVGEVWEDASNKISYEKRRSYLLGEELDGVMGYPFRENIVNFLNGNITSIQLKNNFMQIKENYPKEAFKSNLNLLGSHDVTRIKTELDEDNDKLKLAIVAQMTFEGVPYIYYGDEAGISGGVDPDNRRTYPWKNEDQEMLDFYKDIIKIRNKSKALTSGDTIFLDIEEDDVFGYIRYDKNEKVLSVLNRSKSTKNIKVSIEENQIEEICIKDISRNKDSILIKEEEVFNISLEALSFKIFKLNNE